MADAVCEGGCCVRHMHGGGMSVAEVIDTSAPAQPSLGDVGKKLAAAEIVINGDDARFMDDVIASVHRAVATPLFERTVGKAPPT